MAELLLCQDWCTHASQFGVTALTAERTGVSVDDHGWARYSGTVGQNLTIQDVNETIAAIDFGWRLGYYFTNGQPSDGQYEVVIVGRVLIAGPAFRNIQARLYNVSGTHKFRLWDVTADSQLGSDSAAITVGQTMLVNLRTDQAGNAVDLFVDGSSVISTSFTHVAIVALLNAGEASVGTARYWSAWCLYASGSDDLDEAHYPEMRLLHPNATGNYTDYQDSAAGAADPLEWDDLASGGNPDDDTTWNAGQDATEQETHNLTTHTMTNTIQGVTVVHKLRQDQASKTVVHGAIIRLGGVDKVISYGSEDIGESYVIRNALLHTAPGGGAWSIANLEAGHRRDAGSAALNIRVTALGVVVVALGATDLAPPDPPAVTGDRRRILAA